MGEEEGAVVGVEVDGVGEGEGAVVEDGVGEGVTTTGADGDDVGAGGGNGIIAADKILQHLDTQPNWCRL